MFLLYAFVYACANFLKKLPICFIEHRFGSTS